MKAAAGMKLRVPVVEESGNECLGCSLYSKHAAILRIAKNNPSISLFPLSVPKRCKVHNAAIAESSSNSSIMKNKKLATASSCIHH